MLNSVIINKNFDFRNKFANAFNRLHVSFTLLIRQPLNQFFEAQWLSIEP